MNTKINILHLFSDVLNADTGNITCLLKRCEWRNINVQVHNLPFFDTDTGIENNFAELEENFLDDIDIIYIGSGFDSQLENILNNKFADFFSKKLKDFIEKDKVVLAIDTGYHLLARFIENEETEASLKGLSVFDYEIKQANKRIVGDIILKTDLCDSFVVGFENHLLYLDPAIYEKNPIIKPFADIKYCAQAKERKQEGIVYKNFIGTDLHGTLLGKNPELADYLLEKALENQGQKVSLKKLDDSIENKANSFIIERYGIQV